MKWQKKGFICSSETLALPWYKKNSMVPVPYLIKPDTIRIYLTMCDEKNIGRVGYVDVDADDPGKIIGYSKDPVIDIGVNGSFDDNGVVTASLLQDGDRLYMYYSGYQSCVKVPYMIFTGVAVSEDGGYSFKKLTTEVPMLDRVRGEMANRCVPYVMKHDGRYKMWYTASVSDGWISTPEKPEPLYNLKYQESESPIDWESKAGKTIIDFKDNDEHGICKSTIWREDGLFKIIYSIRSISKGYRLGYGESKDGIHWIRKDDEMGLDVSENGWDSEMVCFAERLDVKGKILLFYSGNHYGMGGIGYAELVKE